MQKEGCPGGANGWRLEGMLEVLRGRRSVRRFRDEPLDRALLEGLVEAATWAPSAGNRQDWFFSVVTEPDLRAKVSEAVRRRWEEILRANDSRGAVGEAARYVQKYSDLSTASAIVAVSCRKTDAIQRALLGEDADIFGGGVLSAAMAAQNLLLAAHASGLGSCCLTGPMAAAEELHRLLGLDRRQRLVCLVALGRPADGAAPLAPARKPVSEVSKFFG